MLGLLVLHRLVMFGFQVCDNKRARLCLLPSACLSSPIPARRRSRVGMLKTLYEDSMYKRREYAFLVGRKYTRNQCSRENPPLREPRTGGDLLALSDQS